MSYTYGCGDNWINVYVTIWRTREKRYKNIWDIYNTLLQLLLDKE